MYERFVAALNIRRRSLPVALIFLASLACYLATRTEVHTFDALSYVLDVDRKPWQELFHPHHLAYGPLGSCVRWLLRAGGAWQGSALVPLQVLNAAAGALGVALFFALLRDITRRLDLALCGALLLGSSYAYWYYAVEVEVYTIAALFLMICLWLLARLTHTPTTWQWAALGLAQGVALLFHQTNLLLSGPALLAILVGGRGEEQAPSLPLRARHLLAYALPLGTIGGGSYLLVGFGVSGLRSWEEFWAWATSYAQTGWWGGGGTGSAWGNLAKGLTETLAQPGGGVVGALLVALALLYARGLVRAARYYTRLALVLLAWVALYGAFFTWWEPDNIEFWIASLPPALLLLMLALREGGKPWHRGVRIAFAVGVTSMILNYGSIEQRGTVALDVHRQIASSLARQSQPDDLLLVANELHELLLVYYEERHDTWSLNKAISEYGAGGWEGVCARVQGRVEAALARGSAVLISHDVVYPPEQPAPLSDPVLKRAGLAQEQVTRCFAPYLAESERLALGDGLPPFYRLPSAQELAETTGWDFTRSRWGWRAHNVRDEQRGAAGWEFTPAVDPQVWSPPLRLDTARYRGIAFQLAFTPPPTTTATLAPASFELFFLDEDGEIDPRYAVQQPLEHAAQPVSYTVVLEGRPGWLGVVTGFRLDPIGVGDGRRMRLTRVVLLR
jgi:hypothetical protein